MAETMTIDSFLHMLLAREWDYRANAALQRLIRGAAFRYKACLEQIDYAIPRGLDRKDVYKRQVFVTHVFTRTQGARSGHHACSSAFLRFPVGCRSPPVLVWFTTHPTPKPVSYTHLDVYKRQNRCFAYTK